jgi:CDP-glucose 4,6-dehydratase
MARRSRSLEEVVSDDLALDRGFWRERPTFVTGATGLLGSNLTAALADAGADVVVLIRDEVPRSRFHELGLERRVTTVRGDVADQALIERALNEYEIETVFHLAAQTIVGTANRSPVSTFESNVRGTWSLLEAVRRLPRVRRVVMASSDKAYGAHDVLPYSEDAPLRGEHPYDASKAAADLIARSFAVTYDVPVAITRCGNLFGEGDLNFNRIVPGTIRSALRGERPVIRSDGTPVRDYFYVQDAVVAYAMLAQAMDGGRYAGEAFNFSNESQVTVLELVNKILALTGQTALEPIVQSAAPHEIHRQYLSAAKARERLGWRARFTLDAALTRTIAWYRTHLADRGAAR